MTRSRTDCRTTVIPFCVNCPGSMRRSKTFSRIARSGKIRSANFLKLGSWIGGDRDGNPFVTDDVMRHALARQSATAMDFYFDELHQLGGELSQSVRIVETTPALDELAGRSPDVSEHRRDEPYRRALTGIYARL